MDDTMIDYMHKIIQKERNERFKESEQLSLGELIKILKKMNNHEDKFVIFDFGEFIPDELHSWRGSYYELAISYKEGFDEMNLTKFIKMLEKAIGKKYYGWKGGEYTMNKNTPIWASNSGDGSHSAIVNVMDMDYYVVLETKYIEY